MSTPQPQVIPLSQWAWYCRDTEALQERGLGVANCLVCGQEPREVVVKPCPASCRGAHGARDVLGHVAWLECGHMADVEVTDDPKDRALVYAFGPLVGEWAERHQHLLAKDPTRLGWKCEVSGCGFFKPAEEFDGLAVQDDRVGGGSRGSAASNALPRG